VPYVRFCSSMSKHPETPRTAGGVAAHVIVPHLRSLEDRHGRAPDGQPSFSKRKADILSRLPSVDRQGGSLLPPDPLLPAGSPFIGRGKDAEDGPLHPGSEEAKMSPRKFPGRKKIAVTSLNFVNLSLSKGCPF